MHTDIVLDGYCGLVSSRTASCRGADSERGRADTGNGVWLADLHTLKARIGPFDGFGRRMP